MIAVKMGVGPKIMLSSGAWFDFLVPSSCEFTIEDIAHGLANICRYSGQCKRFYSVAEHSVLVSKVAKGYELEALLHDAAEAFLGDITRPLKQLLPEYKRIEAEVETAIFKRFGLRVPLPPAIKQADLRVLAAEQQQIMPPGTADWVADMGVQPASVTIKHLDPVEAEQWFLESYRHFVDQRFGLSRTAKVA